MPLGRQFSLLVKPASADCNLRCAYCFYLEKAALYPESSRHRMSDEVLERLVSSYLATDQQQYSFGWQGGEPTLMGVEFFRKITRLQRLHGRPGSMIANGLQTNGTLIDERFAAHLARYRFLLGVSIDGPAELHDHYRKTAGGQGSHARVVEAIRLLERYGVEYNVLTLVSSHNARSGALVYRYLRDSGYLYHQYIPCVEFLPDGTPAEFTVAPREWGAFLCEVFDEWYASDTRRVSVRLFDSVLTWLVEGSRNVCTMHRDCRQYFLVEHNGDVYPCDFFVEPDKKLGNIMEDEWDALLASPRYEAFGRQKSRMHPACSDCPYLDLCAGDCLKNRFYARQDPTQLSYLCTGWKRFYDYTAERFRLLAEEIRRERRAAERHAGANPP